MSFHFLVAVTVGSNLESKTIKSATVSTFSPSVCHEMMGLDTMILVLGHCNHSFHMHLSDVGPVSRVFFFFF